MIKYLNAAGKMLQSLTSTFNVHNLPELTPVQSKLEHEEISMPNRNILYFLKHSKPDSTKYSEESQEWNPNVHRIYYKLDMRGEIILITFNWGFSLG